MLNDILNRALHGHELTVGDLRLLLSLKDETDLHALFKTARRLRERHFGRTVFTYGFIFFSTYCCNRCVFCQYRAPNTSLKRYRREPAEIMKAVRELKASGVDLIDLTMGEDLHYYNNSGAGFREIADLVHRIRSETGLPVMVSPGAAPDHVLADLKEAGADWFACYQETFNRDLFDRLRPGQEYDRRMNKKHHARRLELLVEEGLLAGVGQSIGDMADSIIRMRDMGADQVRVMMFVPGPDTPLETAPFAGTRDEILAIAVMRLAMPDRLIPASLDVDGLEGLEARLMAGANVVTSLVPPGRGLAGVANDQLDIEDSRRTPSAIRPILAKCGLRPAEPGEYKNWITGRLAFHHQNNRLAQDQLAGVSSQRCRRPLQAMQAVL